MDSVDIVMHHTYKHGARTKDNRKDRLYQCWSDMKQRCFNPNNQRYDRYGERGITVCSEWMDYIPFMNWALENGYSKDLTLDRKNPEGDYNSGNCRWTDKSVQSANQCISSNNTSGYTGVSLDSRDNKYNCVITYKGKNTYLGFFDNPKDGAIARDRYIIENNLPHKLSGVLDG